MSIEKREQSCALCHAYLFDEDDVVYCPVCGAPHHRECYNSIGHCALEEFHGTENQYDKVKRAAEEKKEQKAAAEEPKPEPEMYQTPFGGFAPIDFLGGVSPDAVIEDGVTARDAAKFVFSNTTRYIPKFARKSKTSWNFLAFFFPGGWFLSRKMYKGGIIAIVLQIIGTLLTVPFQSTLLNLGLIPANNYMDLTQKLTENMDKIPQPAVMVAFAGVVLSLAVQILAGIFGDWLYRSHVVDTVRKINKDSIDKENDFRKKGGVNLFLFLLGTFAVQYLPAIIVAFI